MRREKYVQYAFHGQNSYRHADSIERLLGAAGVSDIQFVCTSNMVNTLVVPKVWEPKVDEIMAQVDAITDFISQSPMYCPTSDELCKALHDADVIHGVTFNDMVAAGWLKVVYKHRQCGKVRFALAIAQE